MSELSPKDDLNEDQDQSVIDDFVFNEKLDDHRFDFISKSIVLED